MTKGQIGTCVDRAIYQHNFFGEDEDVFVEEDLVCYVDSGMEIMVLNPETNDLEVIDPVCDVKIGREFFPVFHTVHVSDPYSIMQVYWEFSGEALRREELMAQAPDLMGPYSYMFRKD